jgi:hypothetical protein
MTNANRAGLYTQTQYNANCAAGVAAGQNAVTSDTNRYGLHTPDQVQALHVGVPLLTRNAGGQVKLTIGIKKATSMTAPFTDFPFTVPGNAAFLRLEAQK